jgi:Fe-S-cluster-containing dehydrogenase component/formate-dependent nitrite reductase membrane component NrfD
MPTFGFLIDNRKCIGCHACTVACKSEHQVPLGVDRTWVKYIEKGEFPNNRRLFSVMRCNHCEYAPCVTICPVTSLYRRDDGVIDFNPDRCIGCKACMQACPYDALYINPDSQTAAKCNFCTHRLEVGLEPSCVVVCPEQAIVCGDLDDSESTLSRLIERHPVQVRKPEKGTRPKLYYIDGDEASLVPSRTRADGQHVWSRTDDERSRSHETRRPNDPTGGNLPTSRTPEAGWNHLDSLRRVYDVRPRPPAWGWPVVAYTWTKSIAAGGVLGVAAARWLGGNSGESVLSVMGLTALVFLVITTGLLVVDLKQPKRFLYVLLRPQWKSWLVRGAYFLVAYGTLLAAWMAARQMGAMRLADLLLWPTAALAVPTAVYTAFLFAQAKGRDFWQNPLLSVHLLSHALLAGGAIWLLAGNLAGGGDVAMQRSFTLVMLVASLITIAGEVLTSHATDDSRRAMGMILGRPLGGLFWAGGIVVGHVMPILLLAFGVGQTWLAPLLILAGMLAIEWVWVLAPQRIPLS